MPLRPRTYPGTAPVPAAGSPAVPTPAPTASSESEMLLPALLGGGLAAGAYVLTKNPKIASTVGRGVLDLRRMSMLSGLAPLKSFLGNVGGTAMESIERGSMAPLKELLSKQTVREAVSAFKRGATYEGAPATALTKLNVPGRVMGAMDEATQAALVRAGLSPKEATRAMLQTPLEPRLAKALSNPVAEYAVPFRRTPFNQQMEGFATAGDWGSRGKAAANATAFGSGLATGYNAEDPKTSNLVTAAAGRRGLLAAAGGAMGRTLSTGKPSEGAKVMMGMSPTSDYSLAQSVNNATQLFTDPSIENVIPKPAAISALKYLRSLVGW